MIIDTEKRIYKILEILRAGPLVTSYRDNLVKELELLYKLEDLTVDNTS